MSTFKLASASPAIKLLSTLFILAIGISYFFGLLMVVAWVGLSPDEVVQTFSENKGSAHSETKESVVTEKPINLDKEVKIPHRIDRDLLIQDTHIHLPVYTLIAAALALISAALEMKNRNKMWLIFALFLGGVAGFWGDVGR